jgi:hypothetical protein
MYIGSAFLRIVGVHCLIYSGRLRKVTKSFGQFCCRESSRISREIMSHLTVTDLFRYVRIKVGSVGLYHIWHTFALPHFLHCHLRFICMIIYLRVFSRKRWHAIKGDIYAISFQQLAWLEFPASKVNKCRSKYSFTDLYPLIVDLDLLVWYRI